MTVGIEPLFPVFDGTNIWVPNFDNSVTVVRAKGALSGTVLGRRKPHHRISNQVNPCMEAP